MEHIRIKSANHRFLTELAKVRGQNVEDVLDRIVVEWAANIARKRMEQVTMPNPGVLPPIAKDLVTPKIKMSVPGKLVTMPMKANPARTAAFSAAGSRGPAAVLSF